MKDVILLLLTAFYIGIGAVLAIAALGLTFSRQGIDRVADRLGMGRFYARLVWLGGTVFAWPLGLFVLITGCLVLIGRDMDVMAETHRETRIGKPGPIALPPHLALSTPSYRRHHPHSVVVSAISPRN